jgi:hypothetical protein
MITRQSNSRIAASQPSPLALPDRPGANDNSFGPILALTQVGHCLLSQSAPFQGHSADISVTPKGESDGDFIRRISKDLRGTDPTPTEIHF